MRSDQVSPSRYHRSLYRLLILVIVLIVYGSLYPWQYRKPPRSLHALSFLLETRNAYFFNARDFLLNIAVYVPLGFAAYLAIRRPSQRLRSLGVPLILGIGLSTAIELAQAYATARRSNVYDILANGVGTAAGIGAAIAFSASSRRLRTRDAGALAVLACWIASVWFPFVPLLHPHVIGAKAGILLKAGHVSVLPLISSFASWYLAGVLLSSAGVRRARLAAIGTLFLLAGQLCIVSRQPTLSHLVGAVAGVGLFVSGGSPQRSWIAASFLGVVVLRGLAPFRVETTAHRFEWVPFLSLLDSNWLVASQVLIEKVYYYSGAIWSLRATGLSLLRVAASVAVVLFLVEICQIYLRGRSPEITDAILALLIGFGLHLFKRNRN